MQGTSQVASDTLRVLCTTGMPAIIKPSGLFAAALIPCAVQNTKTVPGLVRVLDASDEFQFFVQTFAGDREFGFSKFEDDAAGIGINPTTLTYPLDVTTP